MYKTQKRSKPIVNPNAPFLRINDAVRVTGLSAHYFRTGIKAGTIPYEKSGRTYMINVYAFLKEKNAIGD